MSLGTLFGKWKNILVATPISSQKMSVAASLVSGTKKNPVAILLGTKIKTHLQSNLQMEKI
jgi:hypothetical protein